MAILRRRMLRIGEKSMERWLQGQCGPCYTPSNGGRPLQLAIDLDGAVAAAVFHAVIDEIRNTDLNQTLLPLTKNLPPR